MKDALDGLVSDGTITSDQESSIGSALKPQTQSSNVSTTGSTSFEDKMKAQLESLVSAGTISSDQLSSIISAIAPPSVS